MNLRLTNKCKTWMVWIAIGLSSVWLGGRALTAIAEPDANPTVTVLTPSGAASDMIGEGDDYFTQLLHEPRTMDRHTDLIWQSFGINNITLSNGIWSGMTSNTPAGNWSEIYPLYPGFSIGVNTVAEIGKTGWNYPVQAEKYKQLSFRLKAPAAASNGWWHAVYSNISFTVEAAHYEGKYAADAGNWQVYTATMPWHSPIYGLGFRFGVATGIYQFDWMRLTDLTTSPVYPIKFSVGNTQAGDVVDLECYTTSQISTDSFCGSIKTGIPVNAPGNYQFDWRTAYLPPGNYYVHAVVRRGATTASNVSSGPLTISPAAVVDFTAPSMTSGPDYATVELGAPWNMSDSNSIFTSSDLYRFPHDFAPPCPCFANGELYGTVGRYDNLDSPEFGDPFVYLRVNRNKPIDASKYKYLTYRYKVDRSPWWANSGDRLSLDTTRQVYPAGWVVRGIFFNTWPLDVAQSSNTLNDLIVFDDWNTYQMDLSQGVARGYWEKEAPQSSSFWTGLKYAFRFDFLEGVDPWAIHLDDVKLTGDDTANGSYVVRWSQATGSTPQFIDFYANSNPATCLSSGKLIYQWRPGKSDNVPPAGSNKIYLPIVMGGTSSTPDSFVWNTSSVAAGTYYVCGRINDGHNISTMLSEAAVIISH